jgi:hypothetical protein
MAAMELYEGDRARTGAKERRIKGILVAVILIAFGSILVQVLTQEYRLGQERVRMSTCTLNMKEMSLAMILYTQDNDYEYPPTLNGAPQGWAGAIYPYAQDRKFYHCPDDPSRASPDMVVLSYGINSNLGRPASNAKSLYGKSLTINDLEAPAQTVLFFEVGNDAVSLTDQKEGLTNTQQGPPSGYLSAAGDGTGPCPQWGHWGGGCGELVYATGKLGGRDVPGPARHGEGSILLAADGHLYYFVPNSISSGNSAPKANCNQDNIPPVIGCKAEKYAAGTQIPRYAMTFSTR